MPFKKSQYLKSTAGVREPRSVQNFREVDFEKEARRVLDEAIQKGARIEREAYEAGFAKGQQAGIRLGKEAMAPVLDRFNQTLAELSEARALMLREMEGKIAALAVVIAEKIVHITIDGTSEVIRATVRDVIEQSVDRGEIAVWLSPDEVEVIRELMPALLEIKGVDSVRLVADANVSPGGCRIETSAGSIDATVETAFAEVRTLVE